MGKAFGSGVAGHAASFDGTQICAGAIDDVRHASVTGCLDAGLFKKGEGCLADGDGMNGFDGATHHDGGGAFAHHLVGDACAPQQSRLGCVDAIEIADTAPTAYDSATVGCGDDTRALRQPKGVDEFTHRCQ